MDEDCLDEIFTNNETDEACLREMLVVYMMRSDKKHSCEEIHEAIKKIRKRMIINLYCLYFSYITLLSRALDTTL